MRVTTAALPLWFRPASRLTLYQHIKTEGKDGEGGSHARLLAGYAAPPEMMHARLVQMLDDREGTGRGREELMLIYSEDLAPTGTTYSELVRDDETTAAWKPLETPLIAKAAAAFKVGRRKARKPGAVD
jgi:hypothetical protein